MLTTEGQEFRALRQTEVFGQLDERSLQRLVSLADRRAFERGELVEPRTPGEQGAFAVVWGLVRLYLLSATGRELTVSRRRCGEFFEMRAADVGLGDEMLAEALCDGTIVCVVPWQHFLSAVSRCPEAAASLAQLMLREQAEARRLLGQFAFESMRGRLLRKLHELAHDDPEGVVRETRESLEAMVGARPEDVTKALHEWRSDGIVDFGTYQHRRITVGAQTVMWPMPPEHPRFGDELPGGRA
jgi:CRP-like cAMP-binding protein